MADSEDEYIGIITNYAEDLRMRIAARDRRLDGLPTMESGRTSPKAFYSADHSSTTISSVPSLDLSTATILADHFNEMKKAMLTSRGNDKEQFITQKCHRFHTGKGQFQETSDEDGANCSEVKRLKLSPELMCPQEHVVDMKIAPGSVQQCATDLNRFKLGDIRDVSSTNHSDVFNAMPLPPKKVMGTVNMLKSVKPIPQPAKSHSVTNLWDPRWKNDKENRRVDSQPFRPNYNVPHRGNMTFNGPMKTPEFASSHFPSRNVMRNQQYMQQPAVQQRKSYEPKAPSTRFTLNPNAQPFHPFKKPQPFGVSGCQTQKQTVDERQKQIYEKKVFEPRRDNRRSLSQPPPPSPAPVQVQRTDVTKPISILVRRPNDNPVEQIVQNVHSPNAINLLELAPADIDKMTEVQVAQVVNSLYEGSPREKFKTTFPFLAEGVIQKDNQISGHLRVFSSRIGKILIPDTRECNTHDYVYFLVVREGEYRGCSFYPTPRCLISSKFPDEMSIIVKGYAIVGKARKRSSERDWLVWNDSLGLMSVIPGAARTSCKKQIGWEMELDVVSIAATYSAGRFYVSSLVAMTNEFEKQRRLPEEAFLVQDMICAGGSPDDFKFYSQSLDLFVDVKRTLIDGEIVVNQPYEIVAVPTFPKSTHLSFRGILLIENQSKFWNKERSATKEQLLMRAMAYVESSPSEQMSSVPFTLPPSSTPVPLPSYNANRRLNSRVTFKQVGSL